MVTLHLFSENFGVRTMTANNERDFLGAHPGEFWMPDSPKTRLTGSLSIDERGSGRLLIDVPLERGRKVLA